MKYSILDKRDLSAKEIEILTLLFSKEKPNWLPLIKKLKVIARCGCGKCPTILFGENLESEIKKGALMIDYQGIDNEDNLIGISLFANKNMPTELEFFSIDGNLEIDKFPNLHSLKPH
jgi:hypothetical protein